MTRETPDELRARCTACAAELRSPEPEYTLRRSDLRAVADLIDALLARLTAAEADADRLASALRGSAWSGVYFYSPSTKSLAFRLHDEALALRERPS